jgi:hypothetical protein
MDNRTPNAEDGLRLFGVEHLLEIGVDLFEPVLTLGQLGPRPVQIADRSQRHAVRAQLWKHEPVRETAGAYVGDPHGGSPLT